MNLAFGLVRAVAGGRAYRYGALLWLSLLIVAPTGAQTVPTPESVFGFSVGADGQLFDYQQSIAYFRRLESSTPNVRMIKVGTTSYGREWYAAVISSEANLRRLDEFKAIAQRLAHPDGLSDTTALRLASEGRAIVDISGGLHASEIAGSQHTPQLAYEILSRASEPRMKEILDNVILFLWPTINPDGQDIVVNACLGRSTGPSELYQKYIGHDNNRDSYMLNVVESRVIARVWREWEPNIIYVHHQSSPEPTRIWLPPFADPVGVYTHPIIARTVNTIGMTIAQELDANQQPGAVHMLSTYDAWYPGYIDYMPVYQNIPSFWTETQGGNCANPKPVGIATNFSSVYRDLRPTPLYLSPWPGGEWHLRDAVDYMVTASIATLRYAAKFRTDVLYNRYQAGRDVINKYTAGPPYAYIVPQAQHDPVAPVELLRRLALLGVRVNQLQSTAEYNGVNYPPGTWVVPMNQEFGELVRTLFEAQDYPTIGDDTPYDAAGWTLHMQMGVNVVAVANPLSPAFIAAMRPVAGTPVNWETAPDAPFTMSAVAAGILPPPGALTGTGDRIELDPAQNNSFRFINRALADGATLSYRPPAPGIGGAGKYILWGVPSAQAARLADELWVKASRVGAAAEAGSRAVPTRIALYKSSSNNMDQGWTEWLFDTHDFKYTLLSPAELLSGNLSDRFDVIVFGSQGIGGGGRGGGRGGRGGGAGGGRGGAGGRAGAAGADTAAVADPVQIVDQFVAAGGTVVFWNGGATSAIGALSLPVRNVVAGLPRAQFFTGGSVMRTVVDVAHPVMAGMPAEADVMVYNSPVLAPTDGFEGSVLAYYPSAESPLRSGFLTGDSLMRGQAAAVDVVRGRGHVVLFAFQPQWRGQPTGTFRAIFNSMFFSGAAVAGVRGTPDFWKPPVP